MPNGGCRQNCCLYGIRLVFWVPYKNDRYASKTVRVRDRDRVSVYSLPDDGVRSSILNDSDYVYMQGNGTMPPPCSIDTEGIRYGL